MLGCEAWPPFEVSDSTARPQPQSSVPTPVKELTEPPTGVPAATPAPAIPDEPVRSPTAVPTWNMVAPDDNKQGKEMPALDSVYISDNEEDEDLPFKDAPPPPRYNLRSRKNMANSTNSDIGPSLIPAIHINCPQHKRARGFAAANLIFQLFKSHATMKANYPRGFAGAVLDNKTGNSLEFRHLIKLVKYRDI